MSTSKHTRYYCPIKYIYLLLNNVKNYETLKCEILSIDLPSKPLKISNKNGISESVY